MKLRLREVGNVLPVFGSEEDASYFLQGIPGWTAQACTRVPGREVTYPKVLRAGRASLTSALCTTLKEIDVVTFDPLPAPDFIDTLKLASMPRRAFVDLLLGRDRGWSDHKIVRDIGVAGSSPVYGSG